MFALVMVLVVAISATVLLHQYLTGALGEDAGFDGPSLTGVDGAEPPATPARAA